MQTAMKRRGWGGPWEDAEMAVALWRQGSVAQFADGESLGRHGDLATQLHQILRQQTRSSEWSAKTRAILRTQGSVVGLRGCLRTCCRLRASAPPPLPVICELKCSDMAFFISVDCEYVAGVWKTTFMYTPLSM